MGKKIQILEDLITLEQALIELKGKMEYTFDVVNSIDADYVNKHIDKCSKKEIEKMKNINELLEYIDNYWNG